MSKKVRKTLIFLPLACLLASCANSIEPPKFDKEFIINENSQVILSTEKKSNGEYFSPTQIKLSNTISSLNENKVTKLKYLDATKDSLNILVLPIEFKDYGFDDGTKSIIKNKIKLAFNSNDYSKVGFESVKTFYSKSSFNKFDLNFEVASFYETSKNSSYYDDEEKTKLLLEEAINNSTINGQKINRKDFDGDQDGFIDAVWAIYSAPSKSSSPDIQNDNLRAYTSQTIGAKSDLKNPKVNLFSWASMYFLESGYGHVLINPISKGKIDTHTLIHETGHMLGLQDYYDYNHNSFPASGLDMMDFNIGDHNFYSKMILGWTKPYVVYGDATINLNEVKENNSCIVILKDQKDIVKDLEGDGLIYFNPFSEYILIDPFYYDDNSLNYYDLKNGYKPREVPADTYIKESGYRIYHVDGRKGLVTNKKDFFLYDQNTPFYKGIGFTHDVITNSTFGSNLRYETYIVNKLGYKDYADSINKFDYFNELTLLSKNDKENSFESLYVTTDETGTFKMAPPNNEYLFRSGDTFYSKDYASYFVNGESESGVLFNNQDVFSSIVIFE